jgi:hypothetical protein
MSGFVSTVLQMILMVLALGLIGALASLVVLIPPIRKLARRNATARQVAVFIIGLLSLVIAFGLYTRLGAEVHYIFGTIGAPPWQEAEDPYKPAVVREIWMRLLVPPSLQRPCYAGEAVVCEKADWIAPIARDGGWGTYLGSVGICLISALAGGFLAWLFTTRPKNAV